jgi:hypothetical protein
VILKTTISHTAMYGRFQGLDSKTRLHEDKAEMLNPSIETLDTKS